MFRYLKALVTRKSRKRTGASNRLTQQTNNHGEEISQIIQELNTGDDQIRVDAKKEELIQCCSVTKLIQFLQKDENSDMQFEACLRLINFAESTIDGDAKTVIDAGAVPILIKLIGCKWEDLQEKAIRALGNIVVQCPKNRDIALNEEIMVPLLRFVWNSQQTSAIETAVRTLANLCRVNNPAPDYEKLSLCLPVLSCMLFHDDKDILANVCEALANLICDGPDVHIEAILGVGIFLRLIELLKRADQSIRSPVLRILLNYTSDYYIDQKCIIFHLSVVLKLLTTMITTEELTLKEICRIISNLVTGNEDLIEAGVDAGVVPVLVDIFGKYESDTKREAGEALADITCGSMRKSKIIKHIVQQDGIPLFLNMLNDTTDVELTYKLLGSIDIILHVGLVEDMFCGGHYSFDEIVKRYNGVEVICKFAGHSVQKISTLAYVMIIGFFCKQDEKLQN